MNATITFTLAPKTVFHRRKKLTYPLIELVPWLDESMQADNPLLQQLVKKLVVEGIELESTENKMVWILPGQIQSIELNIPSHE